MRNIILVALLIALATVLGCKPKESQPTESAISSTDMNSTDKKSMEQTEEKIQQSPDAMEDTAAATQTPASGDGAGATQ